MRFFRGLHYVFFFFVGALIGAALGGVAVQTLNMLDAATLPYGIMRLIIVGVAGIGGGISMMWLSRYCVVFITSLAGTFILLESIPEEGVQIFFIPIFLTSVAIQTGFVRTLGLGWREREEEEEEEEEEE
jgi:hypothetical protein